MFDVLFCPSDKYIELFKLDIKQIIIEHIDNKTIIHTMKRLNLVSTNASSIYIPITYAFMGYQQFDVYNIFTLTNSSYVRLGTTTKHFKFIKLSLYNFVMNTIPNTSI
jgi:hypothetical protein